MNILLDDDIDFAKFMDLSDHGNCIRPASDYTEQLVDSFWDESIPLGSKLPWQKTHGLLRFRAGEVSVWTGFSGSGKSMALGQVVFGLLMQGEKACIASMEMPVVRTLKRMASQAHGSSRPDVDFLRELGTILGDGLWFYDQMGMVSADKLVGAINYAARELGCKHFVVDSLMKCGFPEDDWNGQKFFIDRLCTIARDTGIHIHLVAHSKKARDENTPPGKMDVHGAAAITNQADNVFCVWRNKPKETCEDSSKDSEPDTLIIVSKQRNGDWEGNIKLWFDRQSLQLVESEYGNTVDMTRPELYQ